MFVHSDTNTVVNQSVRAYNSVILCCIVFQVDIAGMCHIVPCRFLDMKKLLPNAAVCLIRKHNKNEAHQLLPVDVYEGAKKNCSSSSVENQSYCLLSCSNDYLKCWPV
ncbi:hypothetical protein OS493_036783 [Desmophyllum pertusum]|uniref:Uncharacterized protein n=1 Tax=Desmophyllum pertusum TaxID=174260 RepID=A0A9X0CJM8_9CNID|nr:hypothetical protein OS493_036783 [Desmophyllum pertusum]